MAEAVFPQRVLVLVDGSDRDRSVLGRAAQLIDRTGGTVIALRVVEPPRGLFLSPEARTRQERLFGRLQSELEGELEEAVRSVFAPGVSATFQVLRGRPFQEAIREVMRRDVDLVLVGAAPGSRGGAELDSEVLHLLRDCPCPVWIDRGRGAPVQRILVSVDLEPAEESLPSSSASLMRLGLAVAESEKASLHVVHCWMLYREESMMRLAGEAAEWLIHEAEARHAQRLHGFLGDFRLTGRKVEVHLENGRPEEVIPRLLQRERIDLLVLGSLTRLGVSGLFIGSTAERLIHRASCSLIVAKPEGFEPAVSLDS